MNRLNYFNSYNSKHDFHEDQLTRAYLVVLKHSYHAFVAFFDYCRTKHVIDIGKEEKSFSLSELTEEGWEIDTQKSNPTIETNWLLSVLITDEHLHSSKAINAVKRNARYDGIITFGENLTLIIENKPNSYNVWFNQLNPSKENLDSETKIYSDPVVLEWKEIIKQLNNLLNMPTMTGYEKMMITDFLSYIDESHPKLNPYDNFSLCKGNEALIYRRIGNILKDIVENPARITEHKGWGVNIAIPFYSIRKIGLIFERNKDDWYLELSLIFSDTIGQARNFYNAKPTINHLPKNWLITPNFHFSFMQKNLVWFRASDYNNDLEYWIKNYNKIRQYKISEIPELIKSLETNKIIIYNDSKKKEMDEKIFSKRYSTLNACPGFGIIYTIPGKMAEVLDKTDELKQILKDKIREGLLVIHEKADSFLKK